MVGDKNEESERLPTPEQVQKRRENGENPAARPATQPPTAPPATTEEPKKEQARIMAEGPEATITPRNMQDDTSTQEINYEHFRQRPFYFMFLLFLVLLPQCCLVGCCALFYQKKVMDPRPLGLPQEQTDGFTTGLFACHRDWGICLWACCCPGIRWADTTAKLHFFSTFWKGLIVWLVASFFCQLTSVIGFGFIFWLGFCVFLASYRAKMRTEFQMEDKSNLVVDTCVYYWCFVCAIAQEARHIKEHAQDVDPVMEPETKKVTLS
jgi:Cys-rich protein (TIGR01571 family)